MVAIPANPHELRVRCCGALLRLIDGQSPHPSAEVHMPVEPPPWQSRRGLEMTSLLASTSIILAWGELVETPHPGRVNFGTWPGCIVDL